MLRKISIILTVGLSFFACQLNDEFELGEQFGLEFHEMKMNRFENLKIEFLETAI